MSKVELGLDASGMSAATGYIRGMVEELETDRSISSVVGYVQSELTQRFNLAVDVAARDRKESFLHVYNWGDSYEDESTIGNPTKRLWRLNQVGRGRNRVVNFMFLPETVPTPINPILEGRAREGIHVFTWKAPVMEYGIRISINPIFAKNLIYVDNRTNEIKRSKGTRPFVAGVSPHGKASQKNVFTSFYIAWWQTEAVTIYQNELLSNIEREVLPPGRIAGFARRYQRRTKKFTIQTSIENERTYGQAKINARREIRKDVAAIHAAAAKRRSDLYGD